MKKVTIYFLVILSLTTLAFGQDSSTVVLKNYAGVFYIGSFSANGMPNSFSTGRVGSDATLPLQENLTLNTWVGYEIGSDGSGSAFGKFFVEYAHSSYAFRLGYQPRPIARAMRPAPLTPQGQFEPPAVAAIPGAATGVTLQKQLEHGLDVNVGSFYLPQSKSVEWNISLTQKLVQGAGFSLAGYASRVQKGIGLFVWTEWLNLKGFATDGSTVTGFIETPTTFCAPYLNLIYDRSGNVFQSLECGLTKVYRTALPNTEVLVGIGYQPKNETVACHIHAYVF